MIRTKSEIKQIIMDLFDQGKRKPRDFYSHFVLLNDGTRDGHVYAALQSLRKEGAIKYNRSTREWEKGA